MSSYSAGERDGRKLRTPVFNVMDYFHWPARWLAGRLCPSSVTPHQIIAVGLALGMLGAACFLAGVRRPFLLPAGALLLWGKNVLDKVDGSLARMRGSTSRRGRFYDSLSDLAVSLAAFAGMGGFLWLKHGDWTWVLVSAWACLGSLMQCSYFVFYQVAYVRKVENRPTVNRMDERVTDADRKGDRTVLVLQKIHNASYGWQDRLVGRMDRWARKRAGAEGVPDAVWFGQRWHLAAASFLGLGTHIIMMAASAMTDVFEGYVLWAGAGGYALMAALFFARMRAIKALVQSGVSAALSQTLSRP